MKVPTSCERNTIIFKQMLAETAENGPFDVIPYAGIARSVCLAGTLCRRAAFSPDEMLPCTIMPLVVNE